MALDLYIAGRNGEFGTVDSAQEALLGRRPTKVRAVIAEKHAF